VFSDATTDKSPVLSDHMRGIMDELGISEQAIGTTSIFTGEEELFAFARACSRLVQMGTKEWAEMTSDMHEHEEEQEIITHF